MIKAFKYRIYPTSSQRTKLNKALETCRFVYNSLLEQRKNLYEKEKKSISCFEQQKYVTQTLSLKNSEILKIHSQILQNISVRLDLAFASFFRRIKTGQKPGFPRFKGKNRYNSFTYPQNNGAFRIKGKKIKLSKFGEIKIKQHRPMEGKPKTCTVRKTNTNKWFVTIVCTDVNKKELSKLDNEIGIDVGLSTFATLSDGNRIENPRFFKHEEKQLKKSQKKLSRQEIKTKERDKRKKVVARIHERITNKRTNFCHQETNKLIQKYGFLCIEDLDINKLITNGVEKKLSKSICDAAWYQFLTILSNKAENAGRKVIKVNPAYTSQDCSNCNVRQKIDLSVRQFECNSCHLNINRDLNAAINIKRLGIQSLDVSLRSSYL